MACWTRQHLGTSQRAEGQGSVLGKEDRRRWPACRAGGVHGLTCETNVTRIVTIFTKAPSLVTEVVTVFPPVTEQVTPKRQCLLQRAQSRPKHHAPPRLPRRLAAPPGGLVLTSSLAGQNPNSNTHS